MQEHEYKARDKTVQKMSRDGLREKNLRSKKEKRITGREADEKKIAGHREQELDFGKVRKTHTAEETVEGVKEGKHRLQEFLTGRMWQRLLYVFWVRKRELMYLR